MGAGAGLPAEEEASEEPPAGEEHQATAAAADELSRRSMEQRGETHSQTGLIS